MKGHGGPQKRPTTGNLKRPPGTSLQELAHITKQKASLLSLDALLDQRVFVKCLDGMAFSGNLKSYDNNLNLILLDAQEHLRDPRCHDVPLRDRSADGSTLVDRVRVLGLAVIRGGRVVAVSPFADHRKLTENPFHHLLEGEALK